MCVLVACSVILVRQLAICWGRTGGSPNLLMELLTSAATADYIHRRVRGAPLQRDQQPRRLGGLQDGGRGDPGRLVAARDGHRRVQVLPPAGLHGDAKRARPACAGGLPHRALDPRGGRVARLLRRRREADTFEAELSFLLVNQYGAFNSPGVVQLRALPALRHHRPGGNWAYERGDRDGGRDGQRLRAPQCSACFIQSAQDDLMASSSS
jgi:hypothetical protein